MRYTSLLAIPILGACGPSAQEENRQAPADQIVAPEPVSVNVTDPEAAGPAVPAPAEPPPAPKQAGWRMEGTSLHLAGADGATLLVLSCRAPARLVATAAGFTAIGSEDRFALGLGDEPVTLVADPTRQAAAGVRAEGEIPPNLASLLASGGKVMALYGTQQAGPVEPPAPGMGAAFAKSCAALRD